MNGLIVIFLTILANVYAEVIFSIYNDISILLYTFELRLNRIQICEYNSRKSDNISFFLVTLTLNFMFDSNVN